MVMCIFGFMSNYRSAGHKTNENSFEIGPQTKMQNANVNKQTNKKHLKKSPENM